MKPFEAITKDRGHTALVWVRDGYFMFSVADESGKVVLGSDGLPAQGGADRELPDITRLIAASRRWIDWDYETYLSQQLFEHQLTQHDEETQRLVRRACA